MTEPFESLDELRAKKGFICDMDGVIYHGQPSAARRQGICRLARARGQALPVFDQLE